MFGLKKKNFPWGDVNTAKEIREAVDKHGAYILELEDENGRGVMEHADASGNPEAVKHAMEELEKVPFSWKHHTHSEEAIERALAHGADPRDLDEQGFGIVEYADMHADKPDNANPTALKMKSRAVLANKGRENGFAKEGYENLSDVKGYENLSNIGGFDKQSKIKGHENLSDINYRIGQLHQEMRDLVTNPEDEAVLQNLLSEDEQLEAEQREAYVVLRGGDPYFWADRKNPMSSQSSANGFTLGTPGGRYQNYDPNKAPSKGSQEIEKTRDGQKHEPEM